MIGRFFKNVFLSIGVLLLSVAILYFLIQDKQTQDDVLQSTLAMFGERLLAMIPQQAERDSVQQKYDEFMKKAKEEAVEPEKIEIVAAEILNASRTDKNMPTEDAIALLDYAISTSAEQDTTMGIAVVPEIPPAPPLRDKGSSVRPRHPRTYEDVGKTLKEVADFTFALEQIMAGDSATVVFQVDSSLRILMDDNVRLEIKNRQLQELEKKMHEIEKLKLIQYRKDLEKEVKNFPRTMPTDGFAARRQISPIERKKAIEHYLILDSLWVHHGDSLAAAKAQKLVESGLIPQKIIHK